MGGDTLFPQDGDLSEFGDPFRLGTPLPAWKIPPKWGFPRMGTPHPAWGHPPVREHPQDGNPFQHGVTPQNGDPLRTGTPLPAWGPPLQNGWGHHLPHVFPLFGTGVAGTARVGSGWVAGKGLSSGCPLCWGGALTLSPPTAAKSLLNKKADGVKVRGQRGWREAEMGCSPPSVSLSPFHLSPPAPDQQHQRQCWRHQPQGDPPAHRSGRCPLPCTPQIPHRIHPPAHPIHHHACP